MYSADKEKLPLLSGAASLLGPLALKIDPPPHGDPSPKPSSAATGIAVEQALKRKPQTRRW